jgi:hypothetical protein
MSSILIANNQRECQKLTMSGDNESREHIFGYLSKSASEIQSENTMSSFFTSLLTHDEVYLDSATIELVTNTIGVSNTIKLLDNDILRVTFGLDEFTIGIKQNSYSLHSLSPPWSTFEGFEEVVNTEDNHRNPDYKRLLQFIENKSVMSPIDSKNATVLEVVRDLKNTTVKDDFCITSNSIIDINQLDIFRILRMSEAAKGLIVQNKLGIDSIYQDRFSKQYINTKLGSFSSVVGNDAVKTFDNILNLKGIPNLYQLYKKGVIDIDDILKCRNKFSAGLFRTWFESEDYNEKDIVKILINNPTKEKKATKLIRFLYPNIVGLISPISGVASAAIDSYLVSHLLNGWQPSLFLDDVLGKSIDNKIQLYESKIKKEQMIKRFGSINRNDSCPCQSGKKFKKCHGK